MSKFIGSKIYSVGVRAAFALAALSISTVARADTYVCRGDQGLQDIYEVDLAHKTVRMTERGCVATFRDGANAPLTGLGYCAVVMGPDDVRQFVSLRGNTIVFGGHGVDSTFSYTLDTNTGIMNISTGFVEECHRAHA